MTARTITFAVQIGSGGHELARTVAERLRYRYYDWEVTAGAAAAAGVPPESVAAAEQHASAFSRLLERLLAVGVYASDEATLAGPNAATMTSAIRALTSDDFRKLVERVVRELAERGDAVIVGHAGQVVLRDAPGVLKVLVRGSAEHRAARLARESATALEEARQAVQKSDQERAAFFRQVYRIHMLDASHYDLTLSTDSVPIDFAAGLVLEAASAIPDLVGQGPRVF